MYVETSNPACLFVAYQRDIKASKINYSFSDTLKTVPPPESLVFGQVYLSVLNFILHFDLPLLDEPQVMTDYILVWNFLPQNGWSAPEIKPYAPLSFDPTSSCFHYCTNVFEGMKVNNFD